MARTALWGPAHRVMARMPLGVGPTAQPPWVAPSLDVGGSGIQDARMAWNTGGSSITVPQIVGFVDIGAHPVMDLVPSAASLVSIAANQAGAAGKMVLVSSTGAGITVSSAPTLMFSSLVTVPAGTLFIDGAPTYNLFGNVGKTSRQITAVYSASVMLGRAISLHSAGNDSGGTATIAGWDIYGYPMTQTITLGSGSTVTTTKAFKGVGSITLAGTLSGSNIGAGQADVFGLPFYASVQSATWGFWNNLIVQGTGTFVAGVTTSPATAATGDVRGTWAPASGSDGTKRLTLWEHPALAQMVSSGINVGTFGVTQF